METKVKNREWVKDAAIIFLAVLLVLTFFSNTIMNRTLPEVATAQVTDGSIVAKVRGSGVVTANGKHQVKAKETRTIRAVMIKAGQEVNAGDVLFVLGEGDATELEQAQETLRELQYAYQRSAVSIPNFDYSSYYRSINSAQRTLDDAKAAAKEAKLDYERALGTASMTSAEAKAKLKAAEKELNEAEKALKKAETTFNSNQTKHNKLDAEVDKTSLEVKRLIAAKPVPHPRRPNLPRGMTVRTIPIRRTTPAIPRIIRAEALITTERIRPPRRNRPRRKLLLRRRHPPRLRSRLLSRTLRQIPPRRIRRPNARWPLSGKRAESSSLQPRARIRPCCSRCRLRSPSLWERSAIRRRT